MQFKNNEKLSERIWDLIENEIDSFVQDSTTIAVMYGYYHAQRELVESALNRAESDEWAYKRLCAVNKEYEMFTPETIRDAPLVLMRDCLEDFARARLLPNNDCDTYHVIASVLDNYDWCGVALDMECDFAEQ